MIIEFTKQEVESLLAIINNANIQGASAEFIVALKAKFIEKEDKYNIKYGGNLWRQWSSVF
jgi:hypothetical protein